MTRPLPTDTGKQKRVDAKLMCKTESSIAIIALTKGGTRIAKMLRQSLDGDIYVSERLAKGECFYPIKAPFIDFVHQIFPEYSGIVFITATGIAVRAIARAIKDKKTDPAVVVVDEQGKFSISLLSGHLGGANELATRVAEILKAIPVITTASDNKGFLGVDVLAKKLGFSIDNFQDLKKVSSFLIDGEKVAVMSEQGLYGEKLLRNIGSSAVFCEHIPEDANAAIFISDEKVLKPKIPYVILRPKNTVLGIGSRRGASYDELLLLVRRALSDLNLSKESIRCIASINIKKDEVCINKLAECLKVPFMLYTKTELLKVEDHFPISDFVKKTVGVGSVARPSAFNASFRGKELGFYTSNGITLAIYKRRITWAG